MLLERDTSLEESTGLQLEDALVQPTKEGLAHIRISNPSGLTSVIREGTVLGEAVEAIAASPDDAPEDSIAICMIPDIKKVSTISDSERKRKVLEVLEEPDLPEPEKKLLCDFIAENHFARSLEKGEHGETGLIQMEIDTGDAAPRKQPVRRMPFAGRSEIA